MTMTMTMKRHGFEHPLGCGPVPNTWMGDCLQIGKPSPYVTSHQRHRNLPCRHGRQIQQWPAWLGLCLDRWQETLLLYNWSGCLKAYSSVQFSATFYCILLSNLCWWWAQTVEKTYSNNWTLTKTVFHLRRHIGTYLSTMTEITSDSEPLDKLARWWYFSSSCCLSSPLVVLTSVLSSDGWKAATQRWNCHINQQISLNLYAASNAITYTGKYTLSWHTVEKWATSYAWKSLKHIRRIWPSEIIFTGVCV